MTLEVSSNTSVMSSLPSHSELYRTSSGSGNRILLNPCSTLSPCARTSSLDKRLRDSTMPLGSPTCAVKSPTISTAV